MKKPSGSLLFINLKNKFRIGSLILCRILQKPEGNFSSGFFVGVFDRQGSRGDFFYQCLHYFLLGSGNDSRFNLFIFVCRFHFYLFFEDLGVAVTFFGVATALGAVAALTVVVVFLPSASLKKSSLKPTLSW